MFILFSSFLFAQSNNVSTTVYNSFYHDTLTASIDTADIKFGSNSVSNYYTISAYTTTGIDTIYVHGKGEGDYGIWAEVYPQLIITTTPREYLFFLPTYNWLRLITPDVSANTIFTIYRSK